MRMSLLPLLLNADRQNVGLIAHDLMMQKTFLEKISDERTDHVRTEVSKTVYFSVHTILSHFAIPCLKLLNKEGVMSTTTTRRRVRTANHQGKAPSTQAGNYVREKMHKTKKERRG